MVSVWRGETCVHQKTRRFRLLTDAQAIADALVREEFAHACGSACGDWLPESS